MKRNQNILNSYLGNTPEVSKEDLYCLLALWLMAQEQKYHSSGAVETAKWNSLAGKVKDNSINTYVDEVKSELQNV